MKSDRIVEDNIVLLSYSEVMEESVAWEAVLTMAGQLHLLNTTPYVKQLCSNLTWLSLFYLANRTVPSHNTQVMHPVIDK